MTSLAMGLDSVKVPGMFSLLWNRPEILLATVAQLHQHSFPLAYLVWYLFCSIPVYLRIPWFYSIFQHCDRWAPGTFLVSSWLISLCRAIHKCCVFSNRILSSSLSGQPTAITVGDIVSCALEPSLTSDLCLTLTFYLVTRGFCDQLFL